MRIRVASVIATEVALASLMLIAVPGLSSGLDLGIPGRQAVPPPTSGSPAAVNKVASHVAAAPPPGYQPPLHGTNPHGEGTASVLDIGPTATRPLPGDPSGKSNPNAEIVIGRSLGEQRSDGTYHGHVTIISLLGSELLSADSTPGTTTNGPAGGLNNALNGVCTSTGICLGAATVSSTTTATSSNNSFSTLSATVGPQAISNPGPGLSSALLASLLGAAAESSQGDIATVGNCQIADGASRVAGSNVLGLIVQGVQSTSATRTCNDGTSTAPVGTSSVTATGQPGNPLNLSALLNLLPSGCQQGGPTSATLTVNGTPNTDGGLPGLLPIICNANDTSTNQASIPYNVREGLTVQLLGGNLLSGSGAGNLLGGLLGQGGGGGLLGGLLGGGSNGPGATNGFGDTALAQITTAASESAATAPPKSTTGTPPPNNNNHMKTTGNMMTTGHLPVATTGTTGATGTTGTTGTTSTTSNATAAAHLPFTGYDVTGAVLIGLVLLAGGFAGRRIVTVRERRNSI